MILVAFCVRSRPLNVALPLSAGMISSFSLALEKLTWDNNIPSPVVDGHYWLLLAGGVDDALTETHAHADLVRGSLDHVKGRPRIHEEQVEEGRARQELGERREAEGVIAACATDGEVCVRHDA
eukprot:758330-Hanusia_phi.AAC.3